MNLCAIQAFVINTSALFGEIFMSFSRTEHLLVDSPKKRSASRRSVPSWWFRNFVFVLQSPTVSTKKRFISHDYRGTCERGSSYCFFCIVLHSFRNVCNTFHLFILTYRTAVCWVAFYVCSRLANSKLNECKHRLFCYDTLSLCNCWNKQWQQ